MTPSEHTIDPVDATFAPCTVFAAEGARVALFTCKTCGAAILSDPRDDTNRLTQHYQWHREKRSHTLTTEDWTQ